MRWLLGLLLLFVDLRAADAQPYKCDRAVGVVPLRGSTLLPTNARIWISDRAPWSYTLTTASGKATELEPASFSASHAPVVELRPELVFGEHYTLRGGHGEVITTFLVERGADHTPPAPPVFPETRGDGLEVSVDEDTTLLRVELRDFDEPTRTESFLTTALDFNGSSGCLLPVPTTSACVRLTAIDVAGNESKTVERCTLRDTTIPVAIHSPPAQRENPRALLVLGFIVALLVGIFIVFAPEIDMGWLRRRNSGDELLPAAARQLARTVCRNAIVRCAAVVVGGGIAIVMTGNPIAWFVGLAAVLLVSRQLWVLARAHRILRLLDETAPLVTLHGDHVLRVRSRGESSWLVCSQRQLAIATECVLPLARVLEPR